ncbi:homoserine dehydrogenase [Macrococcoides caseolyticum]
MKQINIALLGLGTVGTGVVQILKENHEQIKEKLNTDIRITWILVSDVTKPRSIETAHYQLTDNIEDIKNDATIDMYVEVMGGIENTKEILLYALNQKKHVITANKDLLAEHLEEMEQAAHNNGVSLKYEASIAGGIPVVNALNYGLNANGIGKFMGIFNGTSNFILSKMTHERQSYEEALRVATELGFAEADPTADVEGIDAARKVTIMSYLAFNQFRKLEDCRYTGIREVKLSHIDIAKAFGYRIKLIGSGVMNGDDISLCVEPMCIPSDHQLSHVEYEYNAIYIDGNAVGDTMYYGKGAGSLATGSAVVSDILNVIELIGTDLHNLPLHLEIKQETREQPSRLLLIIDLYADSNVEEILNEISVERHIVRDGMLVVETELEVNYEYLEEEQLNYKTYRIEGV